MSRLLPALIAILFAASPAHAALQVSGKAKVSFYAKGSPGALDIEGKASEMTMTDDGTTVTCVVPLADLTTGIDLRDHHMKDNYMEVGTYPDTRLSFAKADLPLPAVGETANGQIQAQFTAHGVTRPVTVTYEIKAGKKGYLVDASFAYNASDHGIPIPSYLGITVDPAQSVRARFAMVDQ